MWAGEEGFAADECEALEVLVAAPLLSSDPIGTSTPQPLHSPPLPARKPKPPPGSYKNPGLRVDVVEDIRSINDGAMRAAPRKTGIVILGGGVPKHHINNANLMRNGADYAVYLNTAQEYDGSDSGARPDEAISWGKIKIDAKPVKVCGDATILFPLLVSQTFAKAHWEGRGGGGGAGN